jgi:acyl-CoA thioesterase I
MTTWLIRYALLRLQLIEPEKLLDKTPQDTDKRPHPPARRWIGVGLLALLCGLGAGPSALASAVPTILVLGDSISAGYGIQREESWVSLLADRVTDTVGDWNVVNASISGETTGGGLARLPGALEAHDPDVVIIELGGNDGLRGYPIASIRDNLSSMVVLAKQAGGDVLLVGMQIPPNYGHRYTRSFAEVFLQVAQDHDVPVVPFLLENVALLPELMQDDGIHPKAVAQELLLETVWPYLAPMLER